jgi:hypothetical protein
VIGLQLRGPIQETFFGDDPMGRKKSVARALEQQEKALRWLEQAKETLVAEGIDQRLAKDKTHTRYVSQLKDLKHKLHMCRLARAKKEDGLVARLKKCDEIREVVRQLREEEATLLAEFTQVQDAIASLAASAEQVVKAEMLEAKQRPRQESGPEDTNLSTP